MAAWNQLETIKIIKKTNFLSFRKINAISIAYKNRSIHIIIIVLVLTDRFFYSFSVRTTSPFIVLRIFAYSKSLFKNKSRKGFFYERKTILIELLNSFSLLYYSTFVLRPFFRYVTIAT
jgi:hypothetical protein